MTDRRERVARRLCENRDDVSDACAHRCGKGCRLTKNAVLHTYGFQADAVIRIITEECAKVAEEDLDRPASLIAIRIRELVGKS